MKLSDIEIKNAASLNNKMRESLGWNLNLQAMTPYKASEMMESIDNKLSLIRNSHKAHVSERNPNYMGMLLARQVLESYINETSNNINESISSASDKREKSRQQAIKKAVAWIKRTGKSASDAVKEFDLLPADVKHINKHLSEAELKKKAKPDYLDFDKDGDTKEPMKKALKDKEKVSEDSQPKSSPSVIAQDKELGDVNELERLLHNFLKHKRVNATKFGFKAAPDKYQIMNYIKTASAGQIASLLDRLFTMYPDIAREYNMKPYTRRDIDRVMNDFYKNMGKYGVIPPKPLKKNESIDEAKQALEPGAVATAQVKKMGKSYWTGKHLTKKGVTKRDEIIRAIEKDKKKKKVSESRLMEDELSQAQSILAAKDMVDSLQDMIQEVSKMLNEQLPPLADSIRASIGSAEADSFKNAAAQVLQGLLTQVQSDRETMDQAVRSLSGEPAPVAVPTAGQVSDIDLDYEDEIDDFSASDAAAGGSLPMGREKRD